MNLTWWFLLGLVVLTTPICMASQGPQSTTGTRFYFSFGTVRSSPHLTIYISTPESHAVNFSIRTGSGYNFFGTINSHSTYEISLSDDHRIETADERNKGIVLRSMDGTSRLVVMGTYTDPVTAESFTVFPSYVLPFYTYYVVSTVFIQPIIADIRGFLLLTGTENDNEVVITPTKTVSIPEDLRASGCPAVLASGSSCTFTLHELETLFLRNEQDLTGTKITSTKPLAVFSGHECAHVPVGVGGCEPLVEQVPPVVTWGKLFLVNSLASRVTGEWYKVLAAEGSTTFMVHCVTYENTSSHSEFSIQLFEEGSNHDFFIEGDHTCSIKADKPVLLMLFAPNELSCTEYDGAFMALVPPVEQYSSEYILSTIHSLGYISITIPADFCPNGLCQLLINETTIFTGFRPIYCSIDSVCGYTLAYGLPVGTQRIRHVDPTAIFGVVSYAFSNDWGYGTVAGMELNQVAVHSPNVSILQDPSTVDNSLLLAGSQLTLTCIVIINEKLSDEIEIAAKWLTQGRDISQSPLTTEDGTTYVLEHMFPSLSTSDSSTYTCEASLTSPYAGVLATASESISLSVEAHHPPPSPSPSPASLSYTHFQLLLVGVAKCNLWLLSETEAKVELLRQEVVELIRTKCGCSYSSSLITSPVLQCPTLDPDTSNEVTFRARIQDGGNSPLSSEEVISYLEESRDSALAIQGLLLTIDTECNVTIESFQDPLCQKDSTSDDSSEYDWTIVVMATGAAVVLAVLACTLIVIVGMVLHYRSATKQPKPKPSTNREHVEHIPPSLPPRQRVEHFPPSPFHREHIVPHMEHAEHEYEPEPYLSSGEGEYEEMGAPSPTETEL